MVYLNVEMAGPGTSLTFLVWASLICSMASSDARGQGADSSTASTDYHRQLHALAQSVTIFRDEYGVPHVKGPTDASVVFGGTFARAEDEFHYMEQTCIKMLGRAASVKGKEWLEWDVFLRKLEIERHSKAEYLSAPAATRALCDAFADGMNFFLLKHPEVKHLQITHFEPWYALAGYRLFHLSAIDRATLEQIGEAGVLDVFPGFLSSTMWAAGPSKTQSGDPMLFINPHIPLDAPYELHLCSDEGLNVSGQVAYGMCILPLSGHNGEMGWAITANEPNSHDVFLEKFIDDDGLEYQYGQATKKVDQWQERIGVQTDAGLVFETHTFAKTVHGPVFADQLGRRVALKVAKLDEGSVLKQFHDMCRARNLQEFKSAIAPMDLTNNNICYAGKDGNIFYVYAGAIPKRNAKFDWSQPVDGSDRRTDWNGFFALDELPQVENPKSGYLQNSNSSPFFTTERDNPDETAYPQYMFINETDTGIARRSRQLLAAERKLTLDRWSDLAFDTYLPNADADIAAFLDEWERMKREDGNRARKFDEPLGLLQQWDRRSRVESIATSLYVACYMTEHSSESTYPLLEKLERVMNAMQKEGSSWRVPFGDTNRLQRRSPGAESGGQDLFPSLASPGLPFQTGAVFTFNTTRPPNSRYQFGYHGHSYIGVIEFGETVQARSVMAYGQSRDPESPHYFDQAPLYVRGKFKQAWFDWNRIAERSKRIYHPGE